MSPCLDVKLSWVACMARSWAVQKVSQNPLQQCTISLGRTSPACAWSCVWSTAPFPVFDRQETSGSRGPSVFIKWFGEFGSSSYTDPKHMQFDISSAAAPQPVLNLTADFFSIAGPKRYVISQPRLVTGSDSYYGFTVCGS